MTRMGKLKRFTLIWSYEKNYGFISKSNLIVACVNEFEKFQIHPKTWNIKKAFIKRGQLKKYHSWHTKLKNTLKSLEKDMFIEVLHIDCIERYQLQLNAIKEVKSLFVDDCREVFQKHGHANQLINLKNKSPLGEKYRFEFNYLKEIYDCLVEGNVSSVISFIEKNEKNKGKIMSRFSLKYD